MEQTNSTYVKKLLTRKLRLHISQVSQNLKKTLESVLQTLVANKCTEDGYICPHFITIIQYSSGIINEDYIIFHVTFSCFVANPEEGDIFMATIKTLTLAGVHAEVIDNHGNIPITVFIAHDMYRPIHAFETLHENQKLLVKVIGKRFEVDDPCIYVIAELQQITDGHIPVSGQRIEEPSIVKSPMDLIFDHPM